MSDLLIQDIIGPIMTGPSSSHTAGALAIASMVRKLLGAEPRKAKLMLYGSFAQTYRGHGTDRALVGGLLGLSADDERIRSSFQLAQERGLEVDVVPLPKEPFEHPNTVDIQVEDENGAELRVRGVSIGGGAAKLTLIDGVSVEITGKYNSLVIRQHDAKGVLAFITRVLYEQGINIATARLYRTGKGGDAFAVFETDEAVPDCVVKVLAADRDIASVRVIPSMSTSLQHACLADPESLNEELRVFEFRTGKELLERCKALNMPISELFLKRNSLVLRRDCYEDNTHAYLQRVMQVMKGSIQRPLTKKSSSMGGLIGGEAAKVRVLEERGRGMRSTLLAKVTQYALAVLETNASMGRIVAAPTAGSAGVIPAVLVAFQEERGFTDKAFVRALANASAIGFLIARNASVSGAEGGCQAEIGTASAMAASAVVELCGGTVEQCLNAASNAIANMLGLVCDPVRGLVEVPCQKRNASAAANALVSAEIALAGVENLVDFDETVEAMRLVGCSLPFELRESALGGMAATPSACAYCAACD